MLRPTPILLDQSLKRHMELVSTHTVDLFKIPKVNQREREREREISIAMFFHSSQIYKLYETPLTMGNKSSNIAF